MRQISDFVFRRPVVTLSGSLKCDAHVSFCLTARQDGRVDQAMISGQGAGLHPRQQRIQGVRLNRLREPADETCRASPLASAELQ